MTLVEQLIGALKEIPVRLGAWIEELNARLQRDGERRRTLKAGACLSHRPRDIRYARGAPVARTVCCYCGRDMRVGTGGDWEITPVGTSGEDVLRMGSGGEGGA